MIFLLPKQEESKKRFFGRTNQKTVTQNFTVNGEENTVVYLTEKALLNSDFLKFLSVYRGKVVSHPCFKNNKAVFPLLSDASEYKKICVFVPFLSLIKSGMCKNDVMAIIDKDGSLCNEVQKLLPYVKSLRICSDSLKYNGEFSENIFREYGTRVYVTNSRKSVCGYCCADFDFLTSDGILIFSYKNKLNRIYPVKAGEKIGDELEFLVASGIDENDIRGAYFKN